MSKAGETAIDVVTYAAQIVSQPGTNIIKVKLPTARVELLEAQKVYQRYAIPVETLAERVHHVIQSAFDGRRIVIFSGEAPAADEQIYTEVRAIRDGGGFGSIIGAMRSREEKRLH